MLTIDAFIAVSESDLPTLDEKIGEKKTWICFKAALKLQLEGDTG